MCPAVGQGALAIETREDDGEAARLCSKLEHRDTRAAVTAERAVLGSLGGGCQVPIGANATVENGTVRLRAVVIAPEGDRVVHGERKGSMSDAETLGRDLGQELIANGGRLILESVYGTSDAPANPTLT